MSMLARRSLPALRQLALLVCLLTSMSLTVVAALPASSSAFEGAFCENIGTNEGSYCESVERTKIRRAIGHVENAWSTVELLTNVATLSGTCYGEAYGCESSTGYASADGHGHGRIYNDGPNGKNAAYGYLYE
ncbi:MAG: hypothetical protein ACYCUM_12330 [Solirubrobacteraceae bacterium]